MRETTEIKRVRRRLGLRIAEHLERCFPRVADAWDLDEAGQQIAMLLPLDRAEIAAMYPEEPEAAPSPIKGAFAKLRDALGLPGGISIGGVLDSATKRIQRMNRADRGDCHLVFTSVPKDRDALYQQIRAMTDLQKGRFIKLSGVKTEAAIHRAPVATVRQWIAKTLEADRG